MRNLWKKSSLFRKYFIALMAIVLGYLTIVGTVLMIFIAVQWWNEKTQLLIENAQYISAVTNDAYNEDGEEELWKNLSKTLRVMVSSSQSEFFIVDIDGNVVACDKDFDNNKIKRCKEHKDIVVTENYMHKALTNGFANYSRDDIFGYGKFVVSVPIKLGGEVTGAVFAVEDAITGLVPYMISIFRIFAYTFLIVLIFSFLMFYFLIRKVSNPIDEMKEVTDHFAKGEFEYRANEDYKEQYLSEFAKSLNKMAYELSIEDEAQKSFVANVSHELKTPMTTIGGFIDGILDGTIPKEKEHEYLSIVSNEVKRLSRIVVSMLNLSKIEAGEVNISHAKYDVSTQIFETLLSFEKRINDSKIQIEGFEEMGNVFITADRDLLQQVIYNLFDNAVKFTPNGGTISVQARNLDGKTQISIRNTCNGISNEEISRIFERFYKVDKSRSFDIKGVGLGLYIVKTIVNMHGGEIQAKSINEKLVDFTFTIPDFDK